MGRQGIDRATVKRSFRHFASGKLLSSLIGIGSVLLLVRALSRSDYGLYIALLALMELVQLGTNFGVLPIATRYIPELRNRHATGLRQFVLATVAARVLTLGLGSVAVYLMAKPAAAALGVPNAEPVLEIFALVILFEGVSRFIDVIFDSMLLQGFAQVSIVARNAGRLLGLWVLTGGLEHEVALVHLVQLEALIALAGMMLALSLLLIATSRLLITDTQSNPLPDVARMLKFAVPTYVAQILGLAYGPDTVKLLMTRFIGATETAVFGFAAAMASMLMRYMPSFLLIGMIRPLFVMARERGKPPEDLVRLAGTVFKLNLLSLGPFVVMLLVAGPTLVLWLSGGRLPESLPYLYALSALVVLQTLHATIGLLGVVYEVGGGNVLATLWGLLGLIAGVALLPVLGGMGLCFGLLLSEILWCSSMARSLRPLDVRLTVPTGLGKLLIALVGAAASAWLLLQGTGTQGHAVWSMAAALAAAAGFLGIAAVLRPFEADERAMINGVLPRPVFVW